MIFNIIAALVIGSAIYNSYKDFRKDSSLLKMVYLTRPIDYFWSFLMVLGIMFSALVLKSIDLPKFMTWSWVSMLGSGPDAPSGNIMSAPFKSGSVVFISIFWLVLSLALPYLAKCEEQVFRSLVFGVKNRIITSIKFGLFHMVVGVPLSVALILSVVGYIFSIFYVRTYNKAFKKDPDTADDVALNVSTSVHAKYNFLLITLGSILSILAIFLS